MIKSFLMVAAVIGTLSFTATAFAADAAGFPPGDPQAGQQKAAACAACHGADGNSASPQFPKLAGQSAVYLIHELQDFKSRARKNPIMNGMAAGLSKQDMADLAAWYSNQAIKPGAASPDLVAKGRSLYRGGDQSLGIPACAACHGPAGAGMGPAGWPALAGQHAQYLISQLEAWRSGERANGPNHVMRDVAHNMTDEQIKAVSSYLQGLHPAPEAINPIPGQLTGE
ncbi:MAG TPA: c-type cytochrome [Gammaproteobacteria bacterium]|nr:c-type cytochrome [Gammaproteobacteria bacterium]